MVTLVVVVIDDGFDPHRPADQPSLHREVLRAYIATRTRAGVAWHLTAHPADMSDPCQRPMQTDRHGHPPVGVSSCPVGEFGVGVGACSVVLLLVAW